MIKIQLSVFRSIKTEPVMLWIIVTVNILPRVHHMCSYHRWRTKCKITVNTSSCPWGHSVAPRWANVCENTSVNMHILGGVSQGVADTQHTLLHLHRYCSHVNGSVRQYPVFLTSWTQPEASWHPETPNTCPLPISKIHTPLFLAACNPLIISVGWIWDDWVLKVWRRARSQDTEEQQERHTKGDRIFKGGRRGGWV